MYNYLRKHITNYNIINGVDLSVTLNSPELFTYGIDVKNQESSYAKLLFFKEENTEYIISGNNNDPLIDNSWLQTVQLSGLNNYYLFFIPVFGNNNSIIKKGNIAYNPLDKKYYKALVDIATLPATPHSNWVELTVDELVSNTFLMQFNASQDEMYIYIGKVLNKFIIENKLKDLFIMINKKNITIDTFNDYLNLKKRYNELISLYNLDNFNKALIVYNDIINHINSNVAK